MDPWEEPGFTGYRHDLENVAAVRAMSCGDGWLEAVGSVEDFEEIDPRPWFQIRNQGRKNSCRGHSLGAVGEGLFLLAAGSIDLDGDGVPYEKGLIDDRFSPDWCYYRTQYHDGIQGDRGSTILGGLKTATQDGFCPEVVMPYSEGYSPRCPDEAFAAAQAFRVGRVYVPRGSQDEENLWQWFQTGQGLADMGTMWPLSWSPVGGERFVYDGGPLGNSGGHATALMGCVLLDGEWCYCDANSHSDQAQDAGFFYITRSGMRELLDHPRSVVACYSDLTVPRRRAFRWSDPTHNPFLPA